MKRTKPYPFLYRDKDRQGAERWRLRAPGRPTVTIKGAFGSPEFAANYRAALEGRPPVLPIGIGAKHGTFEALCRSYLRSADFVQLASETQRTRRAMVERFCSKFGKLPVAGLQARHVMAIMDDHAGKPGVARNLLSTLWVLVGRAITDGLRKDDPTVGIKRPKLRREGWHSWEDHEIAAYEQRHAVGSQARLALALALYTGQRAADLIKMGKQHIRDGQIKVTQQKTGTELWIALHPDLKAILEATPSDHLLFLISGHSKPYASAKSFGNAVNNWAKEAGLTGCPLHGLRKACARRLAEAGCSAPEIMSITGHKSLAEVERYVRAANQRRMSQAAIEKVSGTPSYPREVQSYPQEKKA
jgi:integrase